VGFGVGRKKMKCFAENSKIRRKDEQDWVLCEDEQEKKKKKKKKS
jgi:hypothetical protein